MTRNTFELVKNAQIHWIPLDSDDDQRHEFNPVNAKDHPIVQKQLQVWASRLKMKSRAGRDEIHYRESIEATPGDIKQQFGGAAIWMEQVKDPSSELHLIVAREICINLYEWREVNNIHGPVFDRLHTRIVHVLPDLHFEEKIHFVSAEIGVKKLSELSNLFAEQRTQRLQFDIAMMASPLGIQGDQSSEERLCRAQLQRWQKSLDELIGKPQVEKLETAERDVLQSKWIEESKWMESIDFRAAVSKESTRWQSEVKEMKNQNAEAQKKHQDEVAGIREQNVDALLQEKQRGAKETKSLETRLEEQKSVFDGYKGSLSGEKAKAEQLIQRLQNTEERLQNENIGLRTELSQPK